MEILAPASVAPPVPQTLTPGGVRRDLRWDVAFVGILAYLVIEYTRLPTMFPILLNTHIGKIAAGIALLGVLFAPRTQMAARSHRSAIDWSMLAFVGISLWSAFLAKDQTMAWDAFADILRWGVIYFLISRTVTNRWRLHFFVLLFLLLNLKLAQFQIRDYFFQKAFGRSEAFLASGVGAGSVGFFANSNDFGVAMCVVWPLAGLLLFGESKTYLRIFLLISFLVFGGSLLLSGSRGALVGASVTVLVALLKTPKKLAAAFMAFLLVFGALYLLPDANKERIRLATELDKDPNVATRFDLWKTGLQMFRDNPVVGVGPGNYRPTYAMYNPHAPDPRRILAPHSIYIQALSELGTLGTSVLLLLCFLVYRANWETLRRERQNRTRRPSFEFYLAVGLNLALVGYLTSGAFLTVLYYPHLWFLTGLSTGLSVASAKGSENPNSLSASKDSTTSVALMAEPRQTPSHGSSEPIAAQRLVPWQQSF